MFSIHWERCHVINYAEQIITKCKANRPTLSRDGTGMPRPRHQLAQLASLNFHSHSLAEAIFESFLQGRQKMLRKKWKLNIDDCEPPNEREEGEENVLSWDVWDTSKKCILRFISIGCADNLSTCPFYLHARSSALRFDKKNCNYADAYREVAVCSSFPFSFLFLADFSRGMFGNISSRPVQNEIWKIKNI